MTDKEKIKAEVDRLGKELVNGSGGLILGRTVHRYFNKVISLIDSLTEEPVSEDLEEAAIEYCGGNKGADARVRAGFIMGANWQKEQIMKDAIDGLVVCDEKLTHGYKDIVFEFPEELKVDDKVKMIIIKED